jgi:transposase
MLDNLFFGIGMARSIAWYQMASRDRWLQQQYFEYPADQIVLQEYVEAVGIAEERLARIGAAIGEFLPGWSLAPVVDALQALRGVDLVVAVSFVVEIGDIRRFKSPISSWAI